RVSAVGMTNSPFDPEERAVWQSDFVRDRRFFAALRIDPLLLDWPNACRQIAADGFAVTPERTVATVDGVRRFLAHWTRRMQTRYCMVSLPPDFAWPSDSDAAWLLEEAVLPHGREFGQPLALMIGVRRGVNPALRLAGDGVGRSDLSALGALCAAHPENRFLATCLSRENQQELVVLARKFRNLHPFGCWWFTNTPQLITEITTMRLELLGTSFTPQHSDARVVDQLLYKWGHFREILAGCLVRKYAALADAGWEVSDAELRRDAAQLLGGAFERFCNPA
ncbi:MAG: glucuronate isomerase, partial [Verrucomicrobia bacterium]|nr:glucuronate isomerase [Verrucomicrobiota bacterium]